MKHLLAPLLQWYSDKLEQGGYWLVALLMAIESSIIPLPSELVIPPAALLAHEHRGGMTVGGVIVAGTLGSWLGATIMYWVSRLAGRPLALAYGHFVFISAEKIEGSERWFARVGPFGVFFSRLLPVVRHLIGIPAGIARMPFAPYSFYTLIGSATWCSILAWVGIQAGQDEKLMNGELQRVTLWAVAAFVILGGAYYAFVYREMKKTPNR